MLCPCSDAPCNSWPYHSLALLCTSLLCRRSSKRCRLCRSYSTPLHCFAFTAGHFFSVAIRGSAPVRFAFAQSCISLRSYSVAEPSTTNHALPLRRIRFFAMPLQRRARLIHGCSDLRGATQSETMPCSAFALLCGAVCAVPLRCSALRGAAEPSLCVPTQRQAIAFQRRTMPLRWISP